MDLQNLSLPDHLLSEAGLTPEFGVDGLAFPGAIRAHTLDLLDHSGCDLLDPYLDSAAFTRFTFLHSALFAPATYVTMVTRLMRYQQINNAQVFNM